MFTKFFHSSPRVRRSNKATSDRRWRAPRSLQFQDLEQRALMTAAPVVAAAAVSSTQVDLSWNPVSGANRYLIDEWVNGQWKQIGNFGSNVDAVAVNGLNPHTTYNFDVGAEGSAGVAWANYNTITTRSATVTIKEPSAASAYSPVSGTLFGSNGPVFTDVHQGQMGDCWLLSSLAEVAARDPADIKNMFTSLGTTVENGATVQLYSVRFFNSNGVAEHVTVDTELPSGGTYYDQVTDGVLWVALAEKAYAEATGASYVTSSNTGSDSYNALNGGDPSWALQAITGLSANDYSVNPSDIATAWKDGEFIVLGSSPNAGDNLVVGDSEGTHAYAVVGYNPSSSTPFELSNPWGMSSLGGTVSYDGHQVYGGAFYASANMISNDFADEVFAYGADSDATAPANGPQQVAGSSLAPVMYGAPTGNATNSIAADQGQYVAAVDELFAAWNDDVSGS